MNPANAHVPSPDLDLADDTPVSSAFGDVYFSRAGGVAETVHVFLQGNGVPERWMHANRFTIVELGFGTGLNFLVTLKHFRQTAMTGVVLQYIAIEKYPFTPETLRKVLALEPALAREAEELLAAYPLRLPGIHRIHLPCCVLTLCVGEVEAMLHEIEHSVAIDAWYLDGFSPAKNPEMWGDAILAHVGALSHAGTTFATFTSAGNVRRGLAAAGFEVRKVPGFGYKREMLVGVKSATGNWGLGAGEVRGVVPPPDGGRFGGGRYNAPLVPHSRPPQPSPGGGDSLSFASSRPSSSILIIGAGIAGATLARALAERGYPVTVMERAHVASGASGNAAGVLFPQLTKQWNLSTAWYFTAYGFALRQLARWKAAGFVFASDAPGMLRLPRHAEEEAQLRELNETLGLDISMVQWLTRDEASAQAGVSLQTGAAFFPQGTWISPAELCHALLHHEQILLREATAAQSIDREGDVWVVTLAEGEQILASHVCVTSAYDSTALLEEYGLKLNVVGGQVSEIAADDVATTLRSILCHKGYVIPCVNRYLLGATYHREEMLAVTDARHAENIHELEMVLPNWLRGNVVGGRSSVRATTPDRMPYVGAIDSGLYVSTGHGSRGLLSAPLAAEMIASNIASEMAPVTRALAQSVHPYRFKKA